MRLVPDRGAPSKKTADSPPPRSRMADRHPTLPSSLAPPIDRPKEIEVPLHDPGEVLRVALNDGSPEYERVPARPVLTALDRDGRLVAGPANGIAQCMVPPTFRVRERRDGPSEKILERAPAVDDLVAGFVGPEAGKVPVVHRMRTDNHPVVGEAAQICLVHQTNGWVSPVVPGEHAVALEVTAGHVRGRRPTAGSELGPCGLRDRTVAIVERERDP